MILSIKFKPYKNDEWIGYIICKEKRVYAEMGGFHEVYNKIKVKHNELLQRY